MVQNLHCNLVYLHSLRFRPKVVQNSQWYISDKIDKIYSESKKIMGDDFNVSLYKTDVVEELKDNAWAAACILLKLK